MGSMFKVKNKSKKENDFMEDDEDIPGLFSLPKKNKEISEKNSKGTGTEKEEKELNKFKPKEKKKIIKEEDDLWN